MKNALLLAVPARELPALQDGLRGRIDWMVTERLPRAGAVPEPEYVFVDLDALCAMGEGCPGGLHAVRQRFPEAGVVVLSRPEDTRRAVELVRDGACTYLNYPLAPAELGLVLERGREKVRVRSELHYLRDQTWPGAPADVASPVSRLMNEVLERVRQVAPAPTSVLLTGETGTGKSLIARFIHNLSQRSGAPFIRVHCGAIPEPLIESELFGHEKGAFTGALRQKPGRFELAAGGTVFLDEIGSLSLSSQVKLLHVLQERVFQRVGGDVELDADVRIIAATNEDLMGLCEQGGFRRDLFYRLNVFPIEVPALRHRKEDIPLLAQSFVRRFNIKLQKNISGLAPATLEALRDYDWPGNVRELENVVERACILEPTELLGASSLPAGLSGLPPELAAQPGHHLPPMAEARREVVERFEKTYLARLLRETGGVIKDTARLAGVSPRQVHKLMTRHGLDKHDFRRK